MAGVGWPAIVAHRERLLRIAVRRCPTREDAEDVVSEAMLRCATFPDVDEKRLEQFLTSVTVRLCADLHRRADRGARAVVRLVPDLAETVPSPEDAVCEAAEAEVINGLVASLPTKQRAVITDRALGLSVTQIASRHELSYKATESALSRARGALRAALASSFSIAVAAWAVLKPRRAVAALPVATFVVAATVVRLPVGVPEEPVARPPYVAPEFVTGPRDGGAAEAGATRPAARRPATGRDAAPAGPARGDRPVDDRGRTPFIKAGDGSFHFEMSDDYEEEEEDDETPVERAERCSREGVWIEVGAEPSREPLGGGLKCGPSDN